MSEEAEVIEAPEAEQVETAQQESTPETVETEAKAAEEVTEEKTEDKPEKTFTQAELDAIVAKTKRKEARKAERQRLEQEKKAKPEPQAVQDAQKPQLSNFENYEDYYEALAEFKAEEKYNSFKQKEAEEIANRERQSEQEKQAAKNQALIDAGEDKYDDFTEVLESSDLRISEVAYLAILESEASADIVYHLATNEEEADRIAGLSNYAQAKEIGKLEDKLTSKPPKKQSKAPAPINAISTGSSKGNGLSDDLSMDEWMKRRNKQVHG